MLLGARGTARQVVEFSGRKLGKHPAPPEDLEPRGAEQQLAQPHGRDLASRALAREIEVPVDKSRRRWERAHVRIGVVR